MTTVDLDELRHELLELLADEDAERDDTGVDELPRASRTAAIPASREQERMWFLSQLGEGDGLAASAIYLMPAALKLEGRLDVDCLRRVFATLVSRHESLRTALVTEQGELRQVIADEVELPWRMFDLSALTEEEYARALRELERHFATADMDLSRAPLLRIGLIRRSAEEHVLLLTQHHALSDGWSTGVLLWEASILYGAYLRGDPDPLPPLPFQYADYAVWQRSADRTAVLTAQLEYWRRELEGSPPLLTLPTDRPRPAAQTFAGAVCLVEIPAELTRSLQALSRSQGATLFMTLSAAFGMLLGRYANQTDVVFGTPVANRTRQEFEGVLGCFVNTLVLRADLGGEPTFVELLQRMKQTCVRAYANQSAPFEQLVTLLNPARSAAYSALIQTMFTLASGSGEPMRMGEVKIASGPDDSSVAKFDLTLMLSEERGVLRGRFSYNTELFDTATMQRMRAHFLNLLGAIARHPDARIDLIPLTSEPERRALLAEWSEVRDEHPRNATVIGLFEAQARRTPTNVAVRFDGQSVTYAELNARANQLARHLRSMGVNVGAETFVAVCVERSMDLVVALLATMKAGGVYVPLDPGSPKERLAFQLADARPAVLLTQQHLWSLLPEHSIPVFCVEDQGLELECLSGEDLGSHAEAQDLAYVIYTSGSSGRPKGCLVQHRQLAITLLAARDVIGFDGADEIPNIASNAFDISLLELLLPLITGGATRVLDQNKYKDLQYLVAQTSAATFFHAVPSLMAAWLQQLANGASAQSTPYSNLRCLLVGGEAVPAALLQALRARFPSAEVFELYGPTEAAIITTYLHATRSDGGANHCIGRRFSYASAYVLDAKQNLQPIGVPGELCLGGDSLACGYLNNPGLTAEKFVRDPFDTNPGARLYRTGDVVRYRADRTLEYLGRIDNQVKIRGYRIEPGEIENVLKSLPGVVDAVIVAREDRAGDPRLVAYVVLEHAGADAAAMLAPLLKAQLPDYMLPAVYVTLDALPLNSSGKLDRRALPSPEKRNVSRRIAPRTSTEIVLVEIVGTLLHVDAVGVNDHFFNLSGHSLLATQLVSRIAQRLDVILPLRAVFDMPVLEDLAAHVDSLRGAGTRGRATILPAPRTGPIPASFAQERMWFLDQWERQLTNQTPSSYFVNTAWRLPEPLNVQALRRAFETVVARHESLRTALIMVDGALRQVIAERVDLPWTELDLSTLREEARNQALADLRHRFGADAIDLGVAPLFRIGLVKHNDNDHEVLLTKHHAISDGWSLGILMNEVNEAYDAHVHGVPCPLRPPPLQYADYAIWQRSDEHTKVVADQLSYWKTQLAGLPPLLTLPTDRPRPLVQSFIGAQCELRLSRDLTLALQTLSQSQGATLFMTLTAAFALLLGRYANQKDVALGTPIANRTREELEGVVGCFVNTLVLRANLDGEPDFAQLQQRIKQTCLDAYANQDVPFERLVTELNPERNTAHNPLFHVAISMNNQGNSMLGGKDSAVAVTESKDNTAKFDLSLVLAEVDGAIDATFVYNVALFDGATIARMARHFENLLSQLPDARQSIDRIEFLDAAERHQLLVEFNATRRPYPDERVHRLVEAQARRRPRAVAVSCDGCEVTYGELDARASRLAHRLRALGVSAETCVGVFLERSVNTVVTVLGVLKAGGAYLPLEYSAPRERLAYMLENASVSVIVTQGSWQEQLPACTAQVLVLDQAWLEAGAPDAPPDTGDINALANVMYTSGSTGRPKGVCLTHRNIVRLVRGTDLVQLGESDVVMQLGPIGFDSSTFEIWGALLNGGKLVVIDKLDTLSAATLHGILRREQATAAFFTPALFNRYVLEQPDLFGCLRYLFVGGEVLDPVIAREFLRGNSSTSLVNCYGPTEVGVWSAWHLVSAVAADALSVPIGRPFANSQSYVLDPNRMLVPVGVIGELYIGGDGVARGYLDPGLTAEKFVAHPFSSDPGARLYRTGDLVRWLPTGVLDFIGRSDHQIKLRGFRIELAEIETRLMEYTGVREAAVLLREEPPANKHLVAYVVSDEAAVDADSLRAHLKRTLPDYMVPAAFVQLATLPLNANGKLDRAALGAVAMAPLTGVAVVRPRNAIEEKIEKCWRQVLPRFNADVHTSFFDAGGDSFGAVSLVAALSGMFEVAIADVFRWPTIADQAIHFGQETEPARLVKPLRPAGTRTPLVLVPPVDDGLEYFRELHPCIDADVPLLAVDWLSLDDADSVRETVESMACDCVRALRQVQADGPFFLLGYSSGGLVAYEMAVQLCAAGEKVSFVGLIDSQVHAAAAMQPVDEVTLLIAYLRYGFARVIDAEAVRSVPQEQRMLWLADAIRDIVDLPTLTSTLTPTLTPEQRAVAVAGTEKLLAQALDTFGKLTRYYPQPLPVSVTLYTAAETPSALADEARATGPYHGWDRVSPGNVRRVPIPGTHQSMVTTPHVGVLAQLINEELLCPPEEHELRGVPVWAERS